MPTPLVRF